MTANEIARAAYEIHRAYHPPVIEKPSWDNASDLAVSYTHLTLPTNREV